MFTTTKIIGGTAALAVVSGSWEKIKAFFHRFYSMFVVSMEIKGLASYAFAMYLLKEFKCSQFSDVDISAFSEYVRPAKCNLLIGIRRIPNKSTVWWTGYRWITTKRGWNGISITFIRGMFNANELASASIAYYNSHNELQATNNECRFFVEIKQGSIGDKQDLLGSLKGKSGGKDVGEDEVEVEGFGKTSGSVDKFTGELLGWKIGDIGQPVLPNAIDYLSYPDSIMAAYHNAQRWKANELWYKDHLIPWKQGLMFIGRPGTGKTSFIKALGQDLNIPIFIFDVATMTNKDFREKWMECRGWAPCIIAIEDIHSVFDGRKNICHSGKMETGLTFEFLLNTVDGLENSEGIFFIVTGNDLSTVDPALGGHKGVSNGKDWSRPGRVDQVIHFDYLSDGGKLKMAERIFAEIPEDKWMPLVNSNKPVTGAQFQFTCSQLALSLYEK